MARFSETLKNLREISSHIPTPKKNASGEPESKADAFEKALIAVLMKEDYNAVKVALLVEKLITKYKGRAV